MATRVGSEASDFCSGNKDQADRGELRERHISNSSDLCTVGPTDPNKPVEAFYGHLAEASCNLTLFRGKYFSDNIFFYQLFSRDGFVCERGELKEPTLPFVNI
jgi:hypothetical protein